MGEACPVVLLPGLDGRGTLFKPIVRALGPEFEPHIVRYREGLQSFASHIEDVLGVIGHVGRPLILVAESFGGPVSVAATARCPEQVRALCLAATFVTRPDWSTRYIRPFHRALTAIPWPGAALKTVLGYLLAESGADPELMAELVRVNNHRASAVLGHRLGLVARVDQRQALQTLTIPVGYLGGTADRIVSCGRHARQLKDLYPTLQVELLPGAPHMLLQLRPQESAAMIRTLAEQAGLLETRTSSS